MKLLELDQRSPEWEQWRAGGIGASDAPVIYHGVVYDKSIPDLMESKLVQARANKKMIHRFGKSEGNPPRGRTSKVNDRMRHGIDTEPKAREHFIEVYGLFIRPACGVHDKIDWMLASFDGLSTDNRLVVEIKCPSPTSRVHQKVLETKEVPWYYLPQLYHQLEVSGADEAHYYSYTEDARFRPIDRTALIVIPRDERKQADLVKRETEFWDEFQRRLEEEE